MTSHPLKARVRRTGLAAIVGLILFLASCSQQSPPVEQDLKALACERISMVRVMELLRDTRNSAGKRIPKSQWVTAGAIAKAESSLCVNARNSNTNGSVDRGLYQINSIHPYSASCLYRASCNTKAAITIYRQRGNWTAWVTYNRGQHRRHLDEARRAFNKVTGGSCKRDWPLVKRGDSGWNTRALQYVLRGKGYTITAIDGKFGPETEAAVRAWQKDARIKVDGKVGPQTFEKIGITLKLKMPFVKGDAVKAAQYLLNNRYGKNLKRDGVYGPATAKAVREMQGEEKIAVDGVVGPNAWAELFGGKGCK